MTVLCRIDGIGEPGSKGFTLGTRRKLLVVCDERGVYGYENSCPHGRGPLEWVEDQFLNLIQKAGVPLPSNRGNSGIQLHTD